jgi:1-acyl-sn-glycerol-3-phosphate acyltransferase
LSAGPVLGRECNRLVRLVRGVRVVLHVGAAVAIVALVFPRIGNAARARLVHWWSKKVLRILSITLDVRGAHPDSIPGNLVVTANHVSWIDIYVINAVRPTRFVAKAEIRDWPVIGWLSEKVGTIFIMRARRRDTAKINEAIHDVMQGGDCVAFFPEGTTSRGDMLRKFHTSLFEPAVVNAAQVAPAAIRYRHADGEMASEVAYVDDLSFGESLAMIIRQRELTAEITFAAPISTAGRERREVADLAEVAVAQILDVEISRERFTLGPAGIAARPEGAAEAA